MLKEELVNIIKTDIKNDIVSQLMDSFDSQIIPLENENDPSRPSLCREEFKMFLEESIDSTLVITDESVEFGVGDTRKLGFDEELDDDTTDCIKIIGTILQGISGEYVLVTSEMARQMFPNDTSVDLGRTGRAYLMSLSRYNRGVELRGWPNAPVWGFSNFPGLPSFFDDVDIDMEKYVNYLRP